MRSPLASLTALLQSISIWTMIVPPPNYTSPSKIYLCGTALLPPDFMVRCHAGQLILAI